MSSEQDTSYAAQYRLGQQGPDLSSGVPVYPDERLTSHISLPEKILPHLEGVTPAFISPTGEMVMYDDSSMAVEYQKVLDALLNPERLIDESESQFVARQNKGKLIQETMTATNETEEGKLRLDADFKQISRALAVLMDTVQQIADGRDFYFDVPYREGQTKEERRIIFRDQVRDQLYGNRAIYFPKAMLALSDAEMGGLVTAQHGGRDPLEHICEAMASMAVSIGLYQKESDTYTRIDVDLIAMQLSAIMLHDFGKLHNPQDPTHAVGSVFWAENWIHGISSKLVSFKDPDMLVHLPPEVREEIIISQAKKSDEAAFFLKFLIKYHDLAGFISTGKLTSQQALEWFTREKYIPSRKAMHALRAIQEADMDAIPKMKAIFKEENRLHLSELMERLDTFKERMGLVDDAFVATDSVILPGEAGQVDFLLRQAILLNSLQKNDE